MNLTDKTILITGGTQGLGKALALKFDQLGANLILVARREEFYLEFKDQLQGKHQFYAVDVGNLGEVKQLAAQCADQKIDYLINNAGIFTTDELEQTVPDRRQETIMTNLIGTINVTECLLPQLQKQDFCHLLFTASVAALQGFGGEGPEWTTYNASKWGLRGYIIALRDKLKNKPLKISTIYPGGFESNIYQNTGVYQGEDHDQPWMIKTASIVNAILFMLNQPRDVVANEVVIGKFYN